MHVVVMCGKTVKMFVRSWYCCYPVIMHDITTHVLIVLRILQNFTWMRRLSSVFWFKMRNVCWESEDVDFKQASIIDSKR